MKFKTLKLPTYTLPSGDKAQHEVSDVAFYKEIDDKIYNGVSFGYMFLGKVGTGKSALMRIIKAAMAEEQRKDYIRQIHDTTTRDFPSERKPKAYSTVDMWNEYQRVMYSGSSDRGDWLNAYLMSWDYPIVLIDDLGLESEVDSRATGFVKNCIINLYDGYVKRREKGGLYQYVLSSNLSPKELPALYGDRIYDRLLEMFTPITKPFSVESYRFKMAEERIKGGKTK